MSNMIRVSRQRPCKVCGKPDWCLYAADGSAAICPRVKSEHPVGTTGVGWLHKSPGDWPQTRFVAKQNPKPKLQRDWPGLAAKYHGSMTVEGFRILSQKLCLSVETLKDMQVLSLIHI